jgi:hypothetical protein
MTSGRRLAGSAAAVCLLALMVSAPASAVIVTLPSGQNISYLPLLQQRLAPQSSPAAPVTNLDYAGGPVMAANTNFVVYWRPPNGPEYPPDYQPGINQYFTDLAHDSGQPTNVDSVATQLNDTLGFFASYRSSFGGPLIDTDPYPANGCQNAAICLTTAQIQSELASFISANHLPADLLHEYFLLTPPGVESCFDTAGTECSANAFPNPAYCAYHAFSRTNPSFVYAFDPYVVGNYSCDNGQHPNGTTSDGALLGGLSHEHVESITDPIPEFGWNDWASGQNTGYEIGDKCEFGPQFGAPLGTAPNGSPYNQVINGHLYYVQEEWSNQTHQCLQRFSFAGAPPRARFSSTPSAGTTLVFDASGTTARGGIARYDWQWNDNGNPAYSQQQTTAPTISHTFPGPGIYPVALTAFARDGTSIGTLRFVATGDEGPTPAFSVRGAQRVAGSPIAFSATASRDPDGYVIGYTWNFGDGSPLVGGVRPTHTYAAPGSYRVTLTLGDSSHQQASITRIVTVN